MRRIVFSLLLAPLVAGCAASQHAGVAPIPRAEFVQSDILIVATTGRLRTVDDKQREELYRAYASAASVRHPGEAPALAPESFQRRLAGRASIQIFGGPLLGRRVNVLVPANGSQDRRFASDTGSFLFAAGDLVAARGDRDGAVWLDRVLCRGDRSFQACVEKYQAGVFDEETGRELEGDRKPKANGEWVDVSTYVRLSKDPQHHSASELDVRAINRCDDCKGSLPGSVQSSVAAPPAP